MSQRPSYGGQAVFEGVMIQGREKIATACRLKDGSITVRHDDSDMLVKRHRWLRWAFLRGTPALIDSMRIGFRSLLWSTDIAMEDDQQKKPSTLHYVFSIGFSLIIAIGIFGLLPTYALKWAFPHPAVDPSASILSQLIPSVSALVPNTIEGLLRVLMLVGYVLLIGRSKDIKRLFAYHGAEHKVVNAWEAGADLNVESAKRYSRIHQRCGTSFLLLFAVVGILAHSLIGWPVLWLRFVSRLAMIPPIAGVAYELIRVAGKFPDSPWLKILVWPGLLLQRLTTAEPTDDQIEVALKSMTSVLEDEGVVPAAEVATVEAQIAPA